MQQKATHKRLRVALVSDEFTYQNLKNVFDIVRITPTNYLEQTNCDLLFVESAWQGANGEWCNKVGKAPGSDNTELIRVIKHFQCNNIKTIFWNKEDPMSNSLYRDTALHCDYIFTIDRDSIKKYRPHKRVYYMPFFFNPKMFNPIYGKQKINMAMFAGSYYPNYAKRCALTDKLIKNFCFPGLAIYDRNPGSSEYAFPEEFHAYIVGGGVGSDKMSEIYKKYKIVLNINTITDSSTMFARRVIETMACNSVVISSPAKSIAKFFPFVVNSQDDVVISKEAFKLFFDEDYYRQKQLCGMREVFANYMDRAVLTRMLQKCAINIGGWDSPLKICIADRKNMNVKLLADQTNQNYELVEKNDETEMLVVASRYLLNPFLLEDFANALKYTASTTSITKDAGQEYYYVGEANQECYYRRGKETKILNINNSWQEKESQPAIDYEALYIGSNNKKNAYIDALLTIKNRELGQNSQIRKRNEHLERANLELRNQLNAVYYSRFWRLTKPLRAPKKLLAPRKKAR